MNISKIILGGASVLATATAIFAFNVDGKFNGRKQLFTNVSGVCRPVQCFTVGIGTGNGCTANVQYYTQDLGTPCAGPYSGLRTSTP